MEEPRKSDFTWHDISTNRYIEFNLTKRRGINILDSYLVSDDNEKLSFIKELREYEDIFGRGFNFGKRTNKSLITEWKAHNILYKKGWFKKRTQDTGLDPKESCIRRAFYWFVCFIFKEK